MSQSIWTRCGGSSSIRSLAARAWRAVEAQHVVSTAKLTDSPAAQAVLEDLIERAKPPGPPGAEFGGLHVLLSTPFRYPPLLHGSRFATRAERGLWYGAALIRTTLAEVAYYRLLFLEGTAAELDLAIDLNVFRVRLRTRQGVDLTAGPFTAYSARISSPTKYSDSQELGRAMREAGVQAFRYQSARDPESHVALGVLAPRAFAEHAPSEMQIWNCRATRARVDFARRDLVRRESISFDRNVFEVDGALPLPAA